MNIYISTNSLFPVLHSADEPLFLNPDGTRTTFPIGWEGKGRYLPGTLKLFRASDNSEIDPDTYHEEDDCINFTFNSAPASGSYNDIRVRYIINPEDYAFSMGTADSGYPGEEYFLFPNWNNAKGCGKAFWVGKYAASNENGVPVSKQNKGSWVNETWQNQVNSCPTKGKGFHCIRNREWVSIALWSDIMGFTVYGNMYGYTNQGDIDGQGTNIVSAMVDSTDNNHKILTGSGPATFRHNGRMDGISDMAGNIWEAVDGIQLRNGIPYVFDEDNSTYVSLGSGVLSSSTANPMTIVYINNSTQDLLNEGLPVDSAGYAVQNTHPGGFWQNTSGTKICYRGAACNNKDASGMWTLGLDEASSIMNVVAVFVWLARVQLLSCLFININYIKSRWLP